MGRSARFSPDSRRIALLNQDGEFLVYDLASGQPSSRWRAPGPVDLAFRGDGAEIAVVYNEPKNPTCQILEAEAGRLLRSFPLPTTGSSVAWCPDGATLATAGRDSKIYLWDAATCTRKVTLEGSTNTGLVTAFHPSGALLASNGWEGRLRLWDPILGRPVLSLTDSLNPQFSLDGRIVVSVADKLTSYEVNPAVEYRSFAHASGQPINYAPPVDPV